MPDFNVRSDSVNVEQIMEQIRARINEKRGVDYTEQQLREIAAVKLEKFLDPRGVRSDLLERFKRRDPPPPDPLTLPLYAFEDTTIYQTHRGLVRLLRRLLNPILKLFFNPNAIIEAMHAQAEINKRLLERDEQREVQRQERREMDALYYELIHNLVFEMTRVGIENKNLKMRVESIASRLEFNERRARALESVVSYKPTDGDSRSEAPLRAPTPAPQYVQRQPYQQQPRPQPPPMSAPSLAGTSSDTAAAAPPPGGAPGAGNQPGQPGQPETPGQRSRRRRRRRGRRGSGSASAMFGGGQPQQGGAQAAPQGGQPEAPADSGAAPASTSSAGPDAAHDHVQADHADSHEPESDGPDTDTDPQ